MRALSVARQILVQVIAPATACLAGLVMLGLLAPSAHAAGGGDPKTVMICDSHGHCRKVVVGGGGGGHTGGGGSGKGGGGSDSGGPTPDAQGCIFRIVNPPPPKSYPVWGGHTDGYIYAKACPMVPGAVSPGGLGNVALFWSPAPVPTVTSRQLAMQAIAELDIPKPVVRRSPLDSLKDTRTGRPFTYVGLWTWYWVPDASWVTTTVTKADGGVWARLSLKPAALSYVPGDGSAAPACAGHGRPYTGADATADATSASSSGIDPATVKACGARYQHARASVTSTARISWTVSFAGSDGDGGTLRDLTSQSTSTFEVLQIQAPNS